MRERRTIVREGFRLSFEYDVLNEYETEDGILTCYGQDQFEATKATDYYLQWMDGILLLESAKDFVDEVNFHLPSFMHTVEPVAWLELNHVELARIARDAADYRAAIEHAKKLVEHMNR